MHSQEHAFLQLCDRLFQVISQLSVDGCSIISAIVGAGQGACCILGLDADDRSHFEKLNGIASVIVVFIAGPLLTSVKQQRFRPEVP